MAKGVIAFTKDKVIAAVVAPGNKNPIDKSREYGWTTDTLDMVFLEIAKNFDIRHWRILVGEDLSYVVRLTIPANTKEVDEREAIFSQLTEKIPEELTNSQWDYKEVGLVEGETGEKRKDIITFALVHDLLPAITKAVKKAGFEAEAIEPEVVARTRNANPLIGIALKEDLSGDDKAVLNIKPANPNPVSVQPQITTTETNFQPEEVKKKSKTPLILAAFLTCLIGITIYRFKDSLPMVSISQKQEELSPTITPSPQESTAPTAAASVTPAETLAETKNLKIQVQNGSGVRGAADEAKTLLTTAGFIDVATGNADSYDYVETQIVLKRDLSSQVYREISEVLADEYNVIESRSILPTTSEYDVVIVVGEKK